MSDREASMATDALCERVSPAVFSVLQAHRSFASWLQGGRTRRTRGSSSDDQAPPLKRARIDRSIVTETDTVVTVRARAAGRAARRNDFRRIEMSYRMHCITILTAFYSLATKVSTILPQQIEIILNVLRGNKSESSIVSCGCIVLRLNATQESISEAITKGCLETFVSLIKLHLNDDRVVKTACWAISSFALGRDEARPHLASCGAADTLLHALEIHQHCQSLAEAACSALAICCQPTGAPTTATRAALSALRAHGAHPGVVRAACALLAVAAPDAKDALVAAGGLDVLLQALETHNAAPRACAAVCGALASAALDPEASARAVAMHAPRAVAAVLARHGTQRDVCLSACHVLEALALFGEHLALGDWSIPTSPSPLEEADCAAAPLLTALTSHLYDTEVCEAVCSTLASRAAAPPARAAAYAAADEALTALSAAVLAHGPASDPPVLEAACRAVWSLTLGRPPSQPSAPSPARANLPFALLCALRGPAAARSPALCGFACGALANVCAADRTRGTPAERAALVEGVLAGLGRHATDMGAARAACRALTALAGEDWGVGSASAAVGAATRVILLHHEDVFVCEAAVQTLAVVLADFDRSRVASGWPPCAFPASSCADAVVGVLASFGTSQVCTRTGPLIVTCACRVLAHLGGFRVIDLFAHAPRILGVLLNVLDDHKLSVRVCFEACRTFALFAPYAMGRMEGERVANILASVFVLHAESEEVCGWACEALRCSAPSALPSPPSAGEFAAWAAALKLALTSLALHLSSRAVARGACGAGARIAALGPLDFPVIRREVAAVLAAHERHSDVRREGRAFLDALGAPSIDGHGVLVAYNTHGRLVVVK